MHEMNYSIILTSLEPFSFPKQPSSRLTNAYSTPSQPGNSPSQNPISKQNRQHDSHPFSLVSDAVAVQRQYGFAVDLALGCESGLVHTLASGAAIVSAVAEFVYHHATEDVGLLSGRGLSIVRMGKVRGLREVMGREKHIRSRCNGKHSARTG